MNILIHAFLGFAVGIYGANKGWSLKIILLISLLSSVLFDATKYVLGV